MLVISSLSLNHANDDVQISCTKSWLDYGKVYCLQSPEEVLILEKRKEYKHIEFVSTFRTTEKLLMKKLVTINSIIDFAREKVEDLLIINSDIFLSSKPELNYEGISVFQRNDYAVSFKDGQRFENGFDAFFIPHKFLNIFPPSPFALGACWWDYWLPFRAIKEDIRLFAMYDIAFHKVHELQWQQREWNFYANYFKLENNIPINHIGQMGNFVLQTIKNHL